MTLSFDVSNGSPGGTKRLPRKKEKNRVLIVEDDEILRNALTPLLEEEGYQVSVAENGQEALTKLGIETVPDIIVLDLKMPVMNGWKFRSIQKNDPKLGLIPVVAISADDSPPASAISAQAFLRKPVDLKELVTTIDRVLSENERLTVARVDETERLAALGRLAAGVGHEINNPLSVVMMNLSESLKRLRPSIADLIAGGPGGALSGDGQEGIVAMLIDVTEMLGDCQAGGERIRETVQNLQRLSRRDAQQTGQIAVNELLEQSLAMSWNQIRHRARLVKALGGVPAINGNGAALGQVFLTLVINAVQAIPEGNATQNQILISTRPARTSGREGVEVAISDSGCGIAPEALAHVFEPFFTTKEVGQGTGLGLSICRQTVQDHGGRIAVESEVGKGTTFWVFLPVGRPSAAGPAADPAAPQSRVRGRVLVLDDELMVGRAIERSLKREHDVVLVQRAADAIARLERGEIFDLIFCDVVMPDVSGPEFYAMVAERWPEQATRLVFMTGGAFTPETLAFVERCPTRVLPKPFDVDHINQLVRTHMQGSA